MNHFASLAVRNVWARKTRTLITMLGILLGVAAMLAISVMSATTTQSLKDFFAQSSGSANLTIAESGTSGEGFPARMLYRVQNMPGVAGAIGVTRNRALLLTVDKSVSIVIMGVDPAAEPHVRSYTLSAGRFVSSTEHTHNIVLVARVAGEHGIALGDTVTFALPDGTQEKFHVVGLLADEGAGHLDGGNIGFVTLAVAQDVFARGSRLDSIDVIAAPEIAASAERLKALRDELQSMLGDKYLVTFPAATGESVSQALSSLNMGLGIFSVIALFVGMLLIYNTFAMTVAERTREIGMLRALGATRRQVLGLVLGEAAFLGAAGSALGVGGGLLLSIPLVQFMAATIGLALGGFTVPTDGVAQAVLVGLAATFVAAFVPAWQASRIAPTEAMRARAGGQEGPLLRHGWKVGLALLGIAVLDVLRVVSLGEGSLFLIFTFLGSILLMPGIVVVVERVARAGIAALYGPMGQLGSRNLVRARTRTSLTVGVLMVGVVLSVDIGTMGASFKASIDDWINAALGGDFIVSGSEPMREELMHELAQVDGIAAVTPERWIYVTATGVSAAGQFAARDDAILRIGVDPETRAAVSTFQFTGGENAAAAMTEFARGDDVLVSSVLQERWQVRRGDSVRLRTTRGERDFRVAGIVASFMQGGQTVFLTRRDVAKYFGDSRITLFMLKLDPDADSAVVE